MTEHEVGRHQPEQQHRAADRGEQQPVEVAALDVGDERARPRHAGDGEDDRHRQLERLEVDDGPAALGEVLQRADFTTKKNTGVISAGMKNSGSRNAPRIARSAIVTKSCNLDERRARGADADADRGRAWCVVMTCLRFGVRWVRRSAAKCEPVTWRNTSSSVGVRRVSDRTGTPQPLSATATWAIRPAPSAVATASSLSWIWTSSMPSTRTNGVGSGRRVAVDLGHG